MARKQRLTLSSFKSWGAQGGRKRARGLTKEQRSAICRKAAKARWRKRKVA